MKGGAEELRNDLTGKQTTMHTARRTGFKKRKNIRKKKNARAGDGLAYRSLGCPGVRKPGGGTASVSKKRTKKQSKTHLVHCKVTMPLLS